jgi:alpha-mannosidase
LAHWPGQTCDAFEDLKRVATWSLCLGRFWSLADYFRKGEHPYHHGTTSSSSPRSPELLSSLVNAGTADPLSRSASAFRQALLEEQQAMFAGMRELVVGPRGSASNAAALNAAASNAAASRAAGQNETEPAGDSSIELAAAIGAPACDDESHSRSTLLINSHSIGCRQTVPLAGSLPGKSDHLFAATMESDQAVATVDIPGCGFVLIRGDAGRGAQGRGAQGRGAQGRGAQGPGIGSRIREKLLGGPRPIAQPGHLQNEFMEVALSEESGGISGVYSGAIRGNRFSFRLVHVSASGAETVMHCDRMKVIHSTPSEGCIEATGTIRSESGADDAVLAAYTLRYTLQRGSRFLQVDGEIDPSSPVAGSPWNHHYAARVAIASETPICRTLVRDKAHRATSRRMVAPLGVVIDEAERQTLVCANGLAFHRRVGDRFLDTLLLVQGERESAFTIHYGFDVSSPVAAARARIAPPLALSVQPAKSTPDIGWMLHASPKDLLVSSMQVETRVDGRLAAVLRIIQTKPQSCKVKLRFFRNVELAMLVKGRPESLVNQPLQELREAYEVEQSEVACEGDQISLSIPSHAVADLLVLFVA